jgi:hypothetical protein
MSCPNVAATNSSRRPLRPLLQRGFSSSSSSPACQSPRQVGIAILTDPARNQTRSVPYEEETYSSTAWRSSSPAPPHTYILLSNPARTRSSPSIQNSYSPSPSVHQSRSSLSPRIIILSNPAREKQCAMPRSEVIQSKQRVSAAVPAPMRVPTTTPISILKSPVPSPQPPAPAADIKVGKLAVDGKAQNVIVRVLLPKIVHESVSSEERAMTGVHHPGTGTGTDKTSRIAEKIVRRLGLMMRSGSRLATARRKEQPRNCRQTATATAPSTATPTATATFIVSRACAFMRTHTHASTPTLTETPHHSNCQ